MQFLTLLVVATSALAATAVEQPEHSIIENIEDGKRDIEREGKLFAYRTSTSRTLLASTTILALSTCIISVNPVACIGRRKRNILQDAIMPLDA